MLSRCFSNGISASELRRMFIKSALLVGKALFFFAFFLPAPVWRQRRKEREWVSWAGRSVSTTAFLHLPERTHVVRRKTPLYTVESVEFVWHQKKAPNSNKTTRCQLSAIAKSWHCFVTTLLKTDICLKFCKMTKKKIENLAAVTVPTTTAKFEGNFFFFFPGTFPFSRLSPPLPTYVSSALNYITRTLSAAHIGWYYRVSHPRKRKQKNMYLPERSYVAFAIQFLQKKSLFFLKKKPPCAHSSSFSSMYIFLQIYPLSLLVHVVPTYAKHTHTPHSQI